MNLKSSSSSIEIADATATKVVGEEKKRTLKLITMYATHIGWKWIFSNGFWEWHEVNWETEWGKMNEMLMMKEWDLAGGIPKGIQRLSMTSRIIFTWCSHIRVQRFPFCKTPHTLNLRIPRWQFEDIALETSCNAAGNFSCQKYRVWH